MVAQLDVESGTNWWLPLVNAIAAQLRFAGAKADGQADISGDAKQGRFLRQVPDMLMRFFRKMIIDRSPKEVSRTSGLLFLVNHMLAVAFKLNNHKFCESTLRSMAASTFPELETFPLSQRITFRYYEGRYFISMQKYAQACESLELVFNSSPPGKNKR